MNQDARPEGSAVRLDIGTQLAYERTFLAQERTQMAWIRTALSLLSFGFAISKFFEFMTSRSDIPNPVISALTVGRLMMAIGVVSLLIATLQHLLALRALRAQCPGLRRSFSGLTGLLLALLGLAALMGAFIRN